MGKTYIDVPVVGYKTWLITVWCVENGRFKENEDNSGFIRDLQRSYPYDSENPHILE